MDVDEDRRDVVVVVVVPTRLLALSPNALSASRHRLVLLLPVEVEDLLPPPPSTTMLDRALGGVVVKDDTEVADVLVGVNVVDI